MKQSTQIPHRFWHLFFSALCVFLTLMLASCVNGDSNEHMIIGMACFVGILVVGSAAFKHGWRTWKEYKADCKCPIKEKYNKTIKFGRIWGLVLLLLGILCIVLSCRMFLKNPDIDSWPFISIAIVDVFIILGMWIFIRGCRYIGRANIEKAKHKKKEKADTEVLLNEEKKEV